MEANLDKTCLVCGKAVEHGGGFCRLKERGCMIALCCPLCLDTFTRQKPRFLALLDARIEGLIDERRFER